MGGEHLGNPPVCNITRHPQRDVYIKLKDDAPSSSGAFEAFWDRTKEHHLRKS
jgi:hypothetical protein